MYTIKLCQPWCGGPGSHSGTLAPCQRSLPPQPPPIGRWLPPRRPLPPPIRLRPSSQWRRVGRVGWGGVWGRGGAVAAWAQQPRREASPPPPPSGDSGIGPHRQCGPHRRGCREFFLLTPYSNSVCRPADRAGPPGVQRARLRLVGRGWGGGRRQWVAKRLCQQSGGVCCSQTTRMQVLNVTRCGGSLLTPARSRQQPGAAGQP